MTLQPDDALAITSSRYVELVSFLEEGNEPMRP